MDQLRKELEEERQLQELQRLQEEQTGKKRSEKLEWMYATPASGSGANANELEEYLLGKKRVDKMLTGDENAKVCNLYILQCRILNDAQLTLVYFRSELLTRISLRFKMQTALETQQPRSERTRSLPLSSRSKQPTRLFSLTPYVSKNFRSGMV